MPRMRLIIVLTVVVGAFMALAPSANASLGRFINEGLSNSKNTATNRAKQLVEVNPRVAKAVAADMGVSSGSVNWNSVKATSHGTCKGYNTGQGSGGSVHTTTYGTFACWRFSVKVNGSVTKRFRLKDNCSNPLLRGNFSPRPHSQVIRKTIRLNLKKYFKIRVQHTCPSGQTVNISVSGVVRIRVKGRSWTRIWGAYSQKLQASVSASISGKVAVECGGTPPPPSDACVNISGNQTTVPGGMTVDVIGNCVNTHQECGNGSYWSDSVQSCVVNICGNVVIVNGDNNDIDVGGNCNETPPTCPDGRPVPPEGCDRPPIITALKPAHMFPGGTTYAYAKAYDPDGDEMVVNITATGSAIASVDSTVEAPSYYDGLTDTWTTCPVNWKCFRARLRASGVEGAVATVTATVNAGGKTATSSIQTFPILPEQGL